MAKKIYWNTMKEWALNLGLPLGIAGFTLFFMYMTFLGTIVIIDHSNDIMCAGTEKDPCIAIISFSVNEDIFLYPMSYDPYGRNTPFYTDKGLKSWKIFRTWGDGWREIKLNETCTGTWCGGVGSNNKYSFVFRKGKNYTIKIEALKENSYDTIKWGFADIDPFWYGINATPTISTTNMNLELGNQINMTANLTGYIGQVCVDIDHPSYNNSYSCGNPSANFLFNISYFRKSELNDSSTIKNISWNGISNQTIYLRAHRYDEVINYSMNLTGYNVNGTYPSGINLYLDNNFLQYFGVVPGTGAIKLSTLSDSSTNSTITFSNREAYGQSSFTKYIYLPKVATINSAAVNITGQNLTFWRINNSIICGLSGRNLDLGTFKIGSTWHAVSLTDDLGFNGHTWNGTCWIANSTNAVGLVSSGLSYDPGMTIFNIGSTTNLIADGFWGTNIAYTWNGAGWTQNTSLDEIDTPTPSAFIHNGATSITSGFSAWYTGGTGYTLSGSTWNANNSYEAPRGDSSGGCTADSSIWTEATAFYNFSTGDNQLYLLLTGYSSGFCGYIWDSTYSIPNCPGCWGPWRPNSTILYGLNPWPVTQYNWRHYVWNKDGELHMTLGNDDNERYGYTLINDYPRNVSMEAGTADGTKEWNYTGTYNLTQTANITSKVISLLSACTADSSGYCNISLTFYSETGGRLFLDDINVNYTINFNPVTINPSTLENYLNSSTESVSTFNDSTTYVNLTANQKLTKYIKLKKGTISNATFQIITDEQLLNGDFETFSSTGIIANSTGGYNWSETAYYTVNKPFQYASNDSAWFINGTNSVGLWFNYGGYNYANEYGGIQQYITIKSDRLNISVKKTEAVDGFTKSLWKIRIYLDDNLLWTSPTEAGGSTNYYNLSFDVSTMSGRHYLKLINWQETSCNPCSGNLFKIVNFDFARTSGTPINPANLTIDLNNDSILDFNRAGTINGTSIDMSSNFTDLEKCNCPGCISNGDYCSVPVIFNNSVNTRFILIPNITYIPYWRDVPLKFTGSQNGTLEISDIKYDYRGGNKTYHIKVHNTTYTQNETLNVTVFYSDFQKNLPYSWTPDIFFLPKSNNSKNVTAYGQTTINPIINILTTNYGGKNLNLSMRINESYSCLNLTWNTNNTKPNGNKINTSYQQIKTNLEYLNNTKLWLWADLNNCNVSDKRILRPNIDIESYCVDCIWR